MSAHQKQLPKDFGHEIGTVCGCGVDDWRQGARMTETLEN